MTSQRQPKPFITRKEQMLWKEYIEKFYKFHRSIENCKIALLNLQKGAKIQTFPWSASIWPDLKRKIQNSYPALAKNLLKKIPKQSRKKKYLTMAAFNWRLHQRKSIWLDQSNSRVTPSPE